MKHTQISLTIQELERCGDKGVSEQDLLRAMAAEGVTPKQGWHITKAIGHVRERFKNQGDPRVIVHIDKRPKRAVDVFMFQEDAERVDRKYWLQQGTNNRQRTVPARDLRRWIEERKAVKEAGRRLLTIAPMMFWEEEALPDEIDSIVEVVEEVATWADLVIQESERRMSDDRLEEKIANMRARAERTTFPAEAEVARRKADEAQVRLDARRASRTNGYVRVA